MLSEIQPIVEALMHILVLIREKMLMPHHLEKWMMILDTNDCEDLTHLNDLLTAVSEAISFNFPQTLQKVLIINNDNSLEGQFIVFKRKYKFIEQFLIST
jgi:hypothetical protein